MNTKPCWRLACIKVMNVTEIKNLNVFCTLFDSNYLDKGLVLHRSLMRAARDFKLFVLPMDDSCAEVLQDLGLSNTIVLDYEDFENTEGLVQAKSNRSRAEFCWTCTPCLIDYVLENFECEICTYVDADLCFYANPSVAFKEMLNAGATVQIVEHGFSESKSNGRMQAASGRFCVEFNTFVNEPKANAVLKHWKEQCIECCSSTRENGILGDQGYLDAWPELYDNVHVCTDYSIGVAPWNADRFRITREDGDVWVEEVSKGTKRPLVFFHYHNLSYQSRDCVDIDVFKRFAVCDNSLVESIYKPYLAELDEAKDYLENKYGLNVLLTVHPAFESRKKLQLTEIASKVGDHIKKKDISEIISTNIVYRYRKLKNNKEDIIHVQRFERNENENLSGWDAGLRLGSDFNLQECCEVESREIAVFLFTQNVVLNRFVDRCQSLAHDRNVFLTTHMLYPNEKAQIETAFPACEFVMFADFMDDSANAECDEEAFDGIEEGVSDYYARIAELKNAKVLNAVSGRFGHFDGYLCSDDLGVDAKIWLKAGFIPVDLEYYYNHPANRKTSRIKQVLKRNKFVRRIRDKLQNHEFDDEVYVSEWHGEKYVFFGKMHRIDYRMDMEWQKSAEERDALNRGRFESANKCHYLSTLHESGKCRIPDKRDYDVHYIQDGYLPPNYSSVYLKFKPNNVKYYAWDALGEELFKNQGLLVSIMPFRKKLYLPEIRIQGKVKTILVATSGPGDWTAQKNRSDEDLMLEAFIEIARTRKDIEVIYRCHPTWVHPAHNGVNSIKRVADRIASTGLSNIHLSANIPAEDLSSFTLSFKRGSLEEDLAQSDVVFGEHSVSMLDAAFKGIPFASVNLTGRRDLACGLTNLGFPHCESVQEILAFLNSYEDGSLETSFNVAVSEYNRMTDLEE